ncbi:metalloregulator ArsR/SmtB family transcription factor [Reichenbachiella sp. MALMAid0571]|uniref:ArsR/SmtB family transcription factor n=1 Tax=Reichenbachiella sp. MALMAid0571 TaxID=3143939 RepID=UPI0032DF946F
MEAIAINSEKMEKVAFILKTIGHPVRLGIISLLADTEALSVSDICDKLNIEQSLISHHLNNMKLKGILSNRREGKCILYSLKLKEVLTVVDCMAKCNM